MTKEEKETVITWNMKADECSVYTCQRTIWQKLEIYGFKPKEEFINDGKVFAKEFVIPKKLINIRKPFILSKRNKFIRSERMKSIRQAKPFTTKIAT